VTDNFRLTYLTPRYWPTWFGFGCMILLARLPFRLQLAIGRVFGILFYYFGRYRRHITEVNIRLCFPELDAAAQQKLIRDIFIANGIGIIESAMGWWLDTRIWRSRTTFIGLEHLEEAKRLGRGVVMIGAHFTTLDFAGTLLTQVMEFDVTYRENKNDLFDAVMKSRRFRFANKVIHRHDIRGMMRSLKNNGIVWYAPDQDYGAEHSVFAPFFGVPAATITVTSRLSKMNGSPVLFIAHYRNSDNSGYTLEITPIFDNFPTNDDVADATRINKIIEYYIRKQPDQYLWLHRRFKTRPPGEKRPY
jgi:KDO2-lipid IV(A) lauroyltransferase